MSYFIDYFNTVVVKLVEVLDTLKLPGSYSLLYYLLGAIIIGLIFQLIKGGSTEFEQNTNFLNSRIISSGVAKYSMAHAERKRQLLIKKKLAKEMEIYRDLPDVSVTDVEHAQFLAKLKFNRMKIDKKYSYFKSPYNVGYFTVGGVRKDWFD